MRTTTKGIHGHDCTYCCDVCEFIIPSLCSTNCYQFCSLIDMWNSIVYLVAQQD